MKIDIFEHRSPAVTHSDALHRRAAFTATVRGDTVVGRRIGSGKLHCVGD